MWETGGRGPRGGRQIPAPSPASASAAGSGAPVPARVPWWAGRGVEVIVATNCDAAYTRTPCQVVCVHSCSVIWVSMKCVPDPAPRNLHEKITLKSAVFLS